MTPPLPPQLLSNGLDKTCQVLSCPLRQSSAATFSVPIALRLRQACSYVAQMLRSKRWLCLWLWSVLSALADSNAVVEHCPADGWRQEGPQPPKRLPVEIVYFAWLDPENNFVPIVDNNLMWLCETGLVEAGARVHVEVVGHVQHQVRQALAIVASRVPAARITVNDSQNTTEYHGIRKVWDLGQRPNLGQRLVLYFHNKGVSHGPVAPRHLFDVVVGQWRRVMELFRCNEGVHIVAHSFGSGGWPWFNFWWARLTYVSEVVEPVAHVRRRHYYEDWLARHGTCKAWPPETWPADWVDIGGAVPRGDCAPHYECVAMDCARLHRGYSLLQNTTGVACTPPEATAAMSGPADALGQRNASVVLAGLPQLHSAASAQHVNTPQAGLGKQWGPPRHVGRGAGRRHHR